MTCHGFTFESDTIYKSSLVLVLVLDDDKVDRIWLMILWN